DRDEPELAEDGKEILNATRPAPGSGGYADDSDGLVDVLVETAVEHVLQQPGVAVVVLRGHDHHRVRALHPCREAGVLGGLAGIVHPEGQTRHVDELGLYAGPARELRREQSRDGKAHAALPDRTEDDGNEQRAVDAHLGHHLAHVAPREQALTGRGASSAVSSARAYLPTRLWTLSRRFPCERFS